MNIAVILGTTREGRQSIHAAKYVLKRLKDVGHESQLVDFLELPLPFMTSAVEPSKLGKVYPDPHVQSWSNIADAADGFIFVTPEYDHGYPAVLINAIHWLSPEFDGKACGLVGVSSGPVGGARVIEHLRPIMGAMGMYDVRQTVMFRSVKDVFNQETGELLDQSYEKQVDGLIGAVTLAAKKLRS
jgi:NAD(P)H-dependent FMN reductase